MLMLAGCTTLCWAVTTQQAQHAAVFFILLSLLLLITRFYVFEFSMISFRRPRGLFLLRPAPRVSVFFSRLHFCVGAARFPPPKGKNGGKVWFSWRKPPDHSLVIKIRKLGQVHVTIRLGFSVFRLLCSNLQKYHPFAEVGKRRNVNFCYFLILMQFSIL